MHTLYNHSPVRHVLAACRQSNPPLPADAEAGRILFMDDDESIRSLTQGLLGNLGYVCDLAKNGEEALQLYQRRLGLGRAYDAVIMDLTVVGGMGGEQTFKRLRELDPRVRAVVTSGYDSDELRHHLLGLGIRGYLPKPYRVGELGRLLKTVAA
ncbi:MAG: response regulator [Opitutae bacterium]|nr:response regulator [Opitutae bacterium]